MAQFDPELHLRRMAEHQLVAVDHGRWNTDLLDAATALVSCGLIDAGRVLPLLSAYATAFDLRSDFGFRAGAPMFASAGVGPGSLQPLAPRQGSGAQFVIEQRVRRNPAIAWLWQTLADFSDISGRQTAFPVALAVLQTAGLIPARDPELDALRWVRERSMPSGRVGAARRPAPPAVPDEWQRLHSGRTGSFRGRVLSLTIGAVTPWFGGVCLAVDGLVSGPFGFSLQAEICGATLENGPIVLDRNPLACWVSDDNDNAYLGHAQNWSGVPDSRGRSHGSIEFAALDPTASRLTIVAQTAQAQARLSLVL